MRLELLARVVGALNEAQVRYLVVGGVAVVVHGYPRLTADLDLALALDAPNLRRGLEALGRLGYRPVQPVAVDAFADASVRERWIREKGMQVLSLASDRIPEVPVDVFARLPFDFEQAWTRALRVSLPGGGPMPVVDRETLILMKEAAGRVRDREDVAALREGARQ